MSADTSTDIDAVEQQITTPIKTVDESLSVMERMTDNAVNGILPARYLVKNADGDLEEDAAGLFERVAENIAGAEQSEIESEKWREEFEYQMKTLQLMPNSPTLMNAGTDMNQLSACIAGHSPVYTEDGLKRMDEIEVGDKVLTHKNRFKEVTAHWSNGEKETIELKRGMPARSDRSYQTVATPDHEFLNTDEEWVRADELENPQTPDLWNGEFQKSFNIDYDCCTNKNKPVVVDGGRVKLKNRDDPRTAEFDQRMNHPFAEIENNDDLAWLFGMYLAEGDIDGTATRFVQETGSGHIERIVSTIEGVFDVSPTVMDSSAGEWTNIVIDSPFVTELFERQFNTGYADKTLPQWVGDAPESYKESLLDGVLAGDGTDIGNAFRLQMANPTLVYEFTLLARSLGHEVKFKQKGEEKLSQSPTSISRITKKGRRCVEDFDRQEGENVEVYDMEVEDDHSFAVGDFVVHNCFVLEPEDDMEDIFKTAQDAALIFQSGGGVGYSFSDLRPKGAYINSTGGEASGPVSFMRVFDETCNQVKQGGKRRGAQMGILRVDHPDIGRFVVSKRKEGEFDNFNISVGYTDEFIEAVKNGEDFTLYDPTDDYESAYEVRETTAKFYNPEYKDNPEDAYDDGEGAVVSANLWRDHADEITTTDGVSLSEKWEDRIHLNADEKMELPAEFLWDIMIDGAWQNGEPGLFHLDATNREHSFDAEEYPKHEINATNPCVTGDTLVNTPDGLVRAENVIEGDKISTVYGTENVDEILTFEDEEVYQVNLSDGGSIKATEDHRFHVLDGKKSVDKNTPLRDISEGDKIRLEPSMFEREGTEKDYKYQLRRGILTGDGGYTQKTIDVNNRLSISSSEDDTEFNQNVRKLFEESGYNVGEIDTSGRNKSVKLWIADAEQVLEDHNLDPAYSHEKSVDVTEFETQAGVQGFLDGLLATDGSVSMSSNRPQIRWATSSEELANNIRNLALNAGMHARIYKDERKNRGGTRSDGSEIGNGETYTLYNVHVAGESADTFVRNTNLQEYHPGKGERIETLRTDFMLTGGLWQATVESIELCEEQENVFDLYCSGSDTWVTEGYVNRGCAEQPLSEYEACNLAHVNLSLMVSEDAVQYDMYDKATHHRTPVRQKVEEYFSESMDFSSLDRTIEAGVRLLDNVVTQSDFPIDEIEERVDGQRKIGLGIMGFAQMLYQMGIPYGSEESYEVARCVMRYIDRRGTGVSNSLAKERGSFDYWNESKYADPVRYEEWFEAHTGLPAEEYEDGYPIRNHNVTTIAPTGTTSMLGNTSGGCEPVYNVANFKNVGNDIQGDDVLVEFDDYFLETLKANDLNVDQIKEQAEDLMRENEFDGVDDLDVPEKIKDVFVTTQDLSPEQHGMMQRAFQEFCDSGISKTVNLPNEATREDVADAYTLAFEEGDDTFGSVIKGLTVYRDGSRNEQVLTTRMDNGLDEEDGINEKALDLYLSGNISKQAASELGIEVESEDQDAVDCPKEDCDGTLEKTDDCSMCDTCFFSPCS